MLWEVNPDGNQDRVSVPTFEDWKTRGEEPRIARRVSARRLLLHGTGDPQNVPGVRATPDLFNVLKANATLGRTFTADEAVVGAPSRRRAQPRLLDARARRGIRASSARTIQLDSVPFTVVGVMPPAFEFPTSTNVEVWTPLAFDPKDMHGRSRRARSLMVVGRIAANAHAAGRRRKK